MCNLHRNINPVQLYNKFFKLLLIFKKRDVFPINSKEQMNKTTGYNFIFLSESDFVFNFKVMLKQIIERHVAAVTDNYSSIELPKLLIIKSR